MVALPGRFFLPFVVLMLLLSTVTAQARIVLQQKVEQQPVPSRGGQQVSDSKTQSRPIEELPERQAMRAAMQIADPVERLKALEKVRADFPKYTPVENAIDFPTALDRQILATLFLIADNTDAINVVIGRILARIPTDVSPETRLSQTLTLVSQLTTQKVLLDRAEELLTEAASDLDFEGYALRRREAARAENLPLPTRESIEQSFNVVYRSRVLYELGRIHLVKGETNSAEASFKESLKFTPNYSSAINALTALYTNQGEKGKIEAFHKDLLKAAPASSTVLTSLLNFYEREKIPERAEPVLKEILAVDPMIPLAWISLARIEQRRGDDADALEHFLHTGSQSYLPREDYQVLTNLYAKLRGNEDGLEAELDRRYRSLPKAVVPKPYKLPGNPTGHAVLLELFTGSGCGPCIAADLAFEALFERYPDSLIAPLAYHVNIPQPDPMATTEGNARRLFYDVKAAPMFYINGQLARAGGGSRTDAIEVYNDYAEKIDKALQMEPEASLSVRATASGGQVTVTAVISKLPANASGLRLHIVLAERELAFGGENGIRLHPLVVRGMAGDNGQGLPVIGTGTIQHTFDLAAIREDIGRSLELEIARRRPATRDDKAPTFAAEKNAMTAIDPSHLLAVAFIQTPDKTVLQATRAHVAPKAEFHILVFP